MMVRSGKINAKNEWRLDTERSIKGGALFLKILMERWSTRENEERIRGISKSPQLEKSRLVLASYHSGYARVSAALAKLGKNWDESRHLREARKYVNRIFSYCTYFSENQENYL